MRTRRRNTQRSSSAEYAMRQRTQKQVDRHECCKSCEALSPLYGAAPASPMLISSSSAGGSTLLRSGSLEQTNFRGSVLAREGGQGAANPRGSALVRQGGQEQADPGERGLEL